MFFHSGLFFISKSNHNDDCFFGVFLSIFVTVVVRKICTLFINKIQYKKNEKLIGNFSINTNSFTSKIICSTKERHVNK